MKKNSYLDRKNIFICGLFCWLWLSSVYAQQYYPLIKENAYWQTLEHDPNYFYNHIRGRHFFFRGDTTIDSKQYTILGYYNIERDLNSPPWTHPFMVDSSQVHVFGFFREDTLQRKVYIRELQDSMENLLYDFSLIVGDTFVSAYTTEGMPRVVGGIHTVTLADGSTRLAWDLDYLYSGYTYIEGMGSNYHGYFFPIGITSLGGGWEGVCYAENNVSLYPTNSPICYNFLGNTNILTPTITKIYPNPAQHQITIERPQEGAATFQLYNSLGQLVLTAPLQQQQERVELRQLPAGYYQYSIDQQPIGALIIQSD